MKKILGLILPCIFVLSACGGGSSSSGSETTTTPPNGVNPPIADNSIPIYTQGGSIYAFDYSTSRLNNRYTYTLNNNIISERLSFTNPSQVINTVSKGDTYLVGKDGVYIHTEVPLSLNGDATPSNYFISDDGKNLVTSFYNDAGVFPSIRSSLAYRRYDVSGLKVKDYLNKNFLTSTENPTSAATLNASTMVFPQGSVVYKPGVTTILDEYYELYVSHYISYKSFNDVPDIAKYPLTRIFGGIEFRYSNLEKVSYAMYNGKVYQASYYPVNSQVYYNPDNNYLYNDIAADVVGNELVKSCGTQVYNDNRSGCMKINN